MASPTFAGDKGVLEQQIASLLPANARWSLSVVDMRAGTEVLNVGNTDDPLAPGSLMKLFVAGEVLDRTEKNGFDMKTGILHDGLISGDTLNGSIYISGRGNALLSARDIRKAVKALVDAGIRHISGDVIADDALFDAGDMERKKTGPAYAPPSALGLDLHTVSVIVRPLEAGNAPEVFVEPPNGNVRFSVPARTVTGAANTVRITQIDDASYQVTGNIPAGSGVLRKRFSLSDPAMYAAGTFKTILKEAGITVKGEAKKGKTPGDAKQLDAIEGPDLDSLIRDMNVNSLNVVADNLFLLLREKRGQGEDKIGFEGSRGQGFEGVKIADGSGLDGRNMVTAGYMSQYLYVISKKSWFGRFKNSLARGGEGRLEEIGISDARFRVKTGMLEDAFALAGYGVDGKGRETAFAYIVNMPGADVLAVRKHGGEVIRLIAGDQ